jgi:glucose/arabinose dehydrogenase
MKYLLVVFLTGIFVFSCNKNADTASNPAPGEEPVLTGTPKITTKTLLSGYDIIWGMDFLPNGDLIFGEKSGKLYRKSGETVSTIAGFPVVRSNGQGGLLDICTHPDYASNGWIYASYSVTSTSNNGELRLARFRIVNNSVQNLEVLFTTGGGNMYSGHYGSRIAFDTKKMLYLSVGEGGTTTGGGINPENKNAANPQIPWGKIHRMNDNGTIPADNPLLPGNTTPTSVFTYGHRNPQGLVLNPETGSIWQTEHGPQGGDEINIIAKGANYGWPYYSLGVNYGGGVISSGHTANGITEPVFHWTPSIGTCGMAFITSYKFRDWKGNLLVGGLASQKLYRCTIVNNKVTNSSILLENSGRVRNVKQAPDGSVYVSVESPGRIIQLIPE